MVVGGSNALPFYQYNPEVVRVTGCSPDSGKQVGGVEGGGLVTVNVSQLSSILAVPNLVKSAFLCRFGNLTQALQVDEGGLLVGSIQCMPPPSAVGRTLLSVSFNGGEHWLDSETYYEYLPIYRVHFITRLETPIWSWAELTRNHYETDVGARLHSAEVTTIAVGWLGSTVVDCMAKVDSPIAASQIIATLRTHAADTRSRKLQQYSGAMMLGSSRVTSVSQVTHLVSNGPSLSFISLHYAKYWIFCAR